MAIMTDIWNFNGFPSYTGWHLFFWKVSVFYRVLLISGVFSALYRFIMTDIQKIYVLYRFIMANIQKCSVLYRLTRFLEYFRLTQCHNYRHLESFHLTQVDKNLYGFPSYTGWHLFFGYFPSYSRSYWFLAYFPSYIASIWLISRNFPSYTGWQRLLEIFRVGNGFS